LASISLPSVLTHFSTTGPYYYNLASNQSFNFGANLSATFLASPATFLASPATFLASVATFLASPSTPLSILLKKESSY